MLSGWAATVLADELSISLAVLLVIDMLTVCAQRVLIDRCSAANPCAFAAKKNVSSRMDSSFAEIRLFQIATAL
jgi:hypothetical protein